MVDACNSAGEFWDEEEVERILPAHREDELKHLPEAICHAVDKFADGAEQFDDMTIVAVRML